MYGIGGTEICIEQKVSELGIGKFHLNDFTIQLSDVRDMRGFDANKLIIDFINMQVQ